MGHIGTFGPWSRASESRMRPTAPGHYLLMWGNDMDLKNYEFRNQPWFDIDTFETFQQAIPMKTLVVHCFDPRAVEIPQAVASYLGDEVYPGENVLDDAGNRIGHTRTLFSFVNGGGRAAQALEGVAMMEYLFRVQNVAVVHHSFCGLTSMTPDHIVNFFHDHHHADLTDGFDRESWTIPDYNE
jgi:carbonic anhydrase